jgi:hypothetical protein
MLSEAKHLGISALNASRRDLRFFYRDCGIRMTRKAT